MKVIDKIIFCFRITDDLPSFFRLILNSKRLSRSKSRIVPPHKENNYFPLRIRYRGFRRTIFLRTYKGDIDIFYEIFYKGIYSLPSLDREVKVILDLGANVGLAAVYFQTFFPEARIICVEPGKHNFSILLKNLAGNLKDGRTTAINAAVMGHDGKVSFEDGKLHFNGKVSQGGVEDTLALSMATLFRTHNINRAEFVKIDIEGSEKELFQTNVEWLANVDNMIIEMHSDPVRDYCLAVLAKEQFVIHQVHTDPTNLNLYRATKN